MSQITVTKNTRLGPAIVVSEDYRGRRYADFYVTKSPLNGPGFYIFGRNKEDYGVFPDGRGRLICLIGRPDTSERKYKLYNGRRRRGWKTRREALMALVDIQKTA